MTMTQKPADFGMDASPIERDRRVGGLTALSQSL